MSQKPSPPMSSLPFRSRQYKDAAANALAYVEDTGSGHREAPFTSSPPVRVVGVGGKQDDGCAYDFANLLQIENDVRVDNPENLHGNQPVRRMCAVEVGVNDIRPSSPTMMLAGMRSIEEWQSVDTSTNTAGESHSHNQSRCVPTPPLPTSSPSPRSSILLPQGSDSQQPQQQQQQMPPPMNDEAGELQMPRYQRGVVVVSTAAITATPPPQSMSTLFASERSLSFQPMDRVDHNNNNMDEEQDEEEEDLTLSATHEDSMTDMLPPLPVSPRVGGQRHQISISSNNSAILTLERSSDDDEDLPQACTLLLEDDPEDVPPVEGESHTSFSLGMDESRRSSIATSREAAITNAANNTTASLSSQKRPSEAEGGRGMSSSYGCTDHDSHTMTPSPTPDMYTRTGVEHTAEGKQSAAPHEDEEDVDSPQPTAPQRRLDFSDTEEDSHDDNTTDIRNPAATAIGCSSNNRSSFLDDTGSLTDEALCIYTEAVRAYEGTFAAYHANLAVMTTRIAFMTTSMYPTFVTVRGADFLKEEGMEGLLISAPPPPSMPPPPSSPSSPPCGSPRNRSLQSLPLLPPPQGTRSPRLLVSPEVCGLAATCPASFQQALASQQQQQHTLTLDRLFEYYAHHGGVTDEQMSGILDAMFDSVVEMHRSLLTHVWFNVSYAVTVAYPALCTLEQHTRRMLCMRRDLFVRDTIELFMMMLPNNKRNHNNVSARRAASSARRPSGSSSSNSNSSSSNGGILQSMKGVLAAFKRRTSTPSPRRGRGGGEDASAASSGIPQYARRSVSAMTAVRRSSATTTPLPPPSVPPAGTVHLPDIELRRKNGPVLRSRESRPTVFRKRTPPRTPTAEDFTDLTACPLR